MTGAGGADTRRGATVRALVVWLLVGPALAACAAGAPPADPSERPAGTSAATPAAPEPDRTDDGAEEGGEEGAGRGRPAPVRIAVAGDIHFEGALAERLRRPADALAPAARVLAEADVAIVNLETSVGDGGRPEPGKRFTFSAGPRALAALGAAGIDVASMANNHALDFGRDRLPSTLRAARRAAAADPPLRVVGIGADADEAHRAARTVVGGTVVATLAASAADQDPTADPTGHWAARPGRSGVADATDPRRLLREVRRADSEADVVVAYLHWGVQGERCPSPDQRRLARALVAAGADVVVGSHAHEVQGDGRLGAGYVAYGLGNFAWYSPGPTGVLTLTVRPPRERTGRARVTASRWWPATIGPDGLAAADAGPAAAASHARRAALRSCAGLAPPRAR
ncbi:CapA family protein [Nocardioides sp. zg-1228]|uniref:CapA family protein n=1 Tax=Nocardioides sp. zg-1228 TaxID=2763008 RepID=UPI00164348E1|nr:CapA family protein [Nocardioides sp. zg-1228]MBC2934475.1 CapA family protein [Nocardioides sp. zg-1228]QSF59236.1 CapA family protein [Nocardioides sp. zg-1228]